MILWILNHSFWFKSSNPNKTDASAFKSLNMFLDLKLVPECDITTSLFGLKNTFSVVVDKSLSYLYGVYLIAFSILSWCFLYAVLDNSL